MSKTLIILRGLPGSGKSTVAQILSEEGKYPICSADDYFLQDGEYKFDGSKLSLAHKWCKEKAYNAMQQGIEKVIIANTNIKEWEFEPYVEMAKKFDYMVVSLIVENRHEGTNIHGVPEEKIQKMKKEFDIKL